MSSDPHITADTTSTPTQAISDPVPPTSDHVPSTAWEPNLVACTRDSEHATYSKRKRGGSRKSKDTGPSTTTSAAPTTPRPPAKEEEVAAYTESVPELTLVSHALVNVRVLRFRY